MSYKDIRKVFLESLQNGERYSAEELQDICEGGMTFEKGRGPIYNIAHKLKENGRIGVDENCKYYLKNLQENDAGNNQSEKVEAENSELKVSIKMIEKYLELYSHFDWVRCSEQELKKAREEVRQLIQLSQNIERKFEKFQ